MSRHVGQNRLFPTLILLAIALILDLNAPLLAANSNDQDVMAVKAAIQRYREAYESMDIAELQKVWPTMTTAQRQALASAFKTFKAIKAVYICAEPAIQSDAAQIVCTETVSYLDFEGKSPTTSGYAIAFEFKKQSGSWYLQRRHRPDADLIKDLAARFQLAWESKDVEEVQKVWPTISEATKSSLRKTFATVKRQELQLQCTEPVIQGDAAQYDCMEAATTMAFCAAANDPSCPANGLKVTQTAYVPVRFAFKRVAGTWRLESHQGR